MTSSLSVSVLTSNELPTNAHHKHTSVHGYITWKSDSLVSKFINFVAYNNARFQKR